MDSAAHTASRPSELSESDRKILADYWRSRGEGEMGAELFFVRLLDDLRVLGAAGPLLKLGERCRRDERKHGLWGRDWAVCFGHPDVSDPVAQRTRALTFPRAGERDNRLLRITFAALTESCGCQVLLDIRPRITFEPLRKNNQLHLADEVVHARLAWAFLTTLSASDRRLIERYVPLLLRLLPQVVCDGPESDDYDYLVPWGYLTPSVLRAAHQRALVEVIEPGLEYLGIAPASRRRTA
ncbi:MAG TPA: hypothetical protein VN764_08645 [Polyangiaceae bacterium]|nr:hypothetical protein [Polyangiaceae bacterium]